MNRSLLLVLLLAGGGNALAQPIEIVTQPVVAGGSSDQCLDDTDFPPHAGRPSPRKWSAIANAQGADEIWHYRQNAKRLGVTIFVGYPVPSEVPSEETAYLGMRGIYVLRSQVSKACDYQLSPW